MLINKERRINIHRLDETPVLDQKSKDLIKEYLKIESFYKFALREVSAKVENLDDYCSMNFSHNPIHHMEARLKSPESIIEKIHKRGYEYTIESLKENVYDISGIRVVCNYIRDIYMLIYLLEEQEDLEVRIKKDYILNPKESGYRSVHVVFQTRVTMSSETRWVPVEIQFRTIAMDMWASLEHELRYKSKYELDDETNERLRMYADELYKIDTNMQRIFIKSTSEGDFND